MSPWPLGDLQAQVTMQWVINSRGMANSLNPLDHPWNFDSATVAKHRLRSITRADRLACGDGKWVKAMNSMFWSKVVAYAFGHLDWGKPMSLSEVCRNLKPRYRWEWRR